MDKAFTKASKTPTDKTLEDIKEVMLEVEKYNYKNQFVLPITEDTIVKSLAAKAKRRGRSVEGLSVDPRIEAIIFDLGSKSRVFQTQVPDDGRSYLPVSGPADNSEESEEE